MKHVGCLLFSSFLMIISQIHGECLVKKFEASVSGIEMTSRNGRKFCSFRGIPYAVPPTGQLRFKDPQPIESWTQDLDATSDGPICIQNIGVAYGQEDCLYLNIYTPQTNFPSNLTLPVIVFVHGGAFEIGSGISAYFGPQYFLDKDVVLVAMNYRLGVFGFISTGNDDAPGNFGLKDQVLALQWVQDNIAEYGGDPTKVTLQGQSAGAQSVNYHMFSSLSKGLFHAAIGESGSAFKASMIPVDDPLLLAQKQAQEVDCPTQNSSVLIACLRNLDANFLISKQLSKSFKPVVEVQSEMNPKPFVTAPPLELVQSGEFYRVPWILGCNSEEGIGLLSAKIFNQEDLDNLNRNFDAEAYSDFFLPLSINDSLIPSTWQKIADFYLGSNHTVTPETVDEFIKMASDRAIAHSVFKAAQLHTQAGHEPIYFYSFDYHGEHSYTQKANYGNGSVDLGVGHSDELIYMFPNALFPAPPAGHPDNDVITTFVTFWTNFATYGNPTPPDVELPQNITWQPINANDGGIIYLRFGQSDNFSSEYDIKPLKISLERNYLAYRMAFWNSLPLKENMVY